ncbi:hypothetical protein [Rubellicoccus peritrichatus]|uniref:Uncharacterized protein n=1 Tax=Rubellicoccus peritrichatus TaxID=3080537 RepID=A0AAQ3LAJ5_9BACT|nr:hypothetical protein [Puniceicoccus sp. CR14]WOO41004.1 hypothetical protein RZN69_20485 [Puniceicoccus sp. CR14]
MKLWVLSLALLLSFHVECFGLGIVAVELGKDHHWGIESDPLTNEKGVWLSHEQNGATHSGFFLQYLTSPTTVSDDTLPFFIPKGDAQSRAIVDWPNANQEPIAVFAEQMGTMLLPSAIVVYGENDDVDEDDDEANARVAPYALPGDALGFLQPTFTQGIPTHFLDSSVSIRRSNLSLEPVVGLPLATDRESHQRNGRSIGPVVYVGRHAPVVGNTRKAGSYGSGYTQGNHVRPPMGTPNRSMFPHAYVWKPDKYDRRALSARMGSGLGNGNLLGSGNVGETSQQDSVSESAVMKAAPSNMEYFVLEGSDCDDEDKDKLEHCSIAQDGTTTSKALATPMAPLATPPDSGLGIFRETNGNENQYDFIQAAADANPILIRETTGAVISDHIRFIFSDEFTFFEIDTPVGWQTQQSSFGGTTEVIYYIPGDGSSPVNLKDGLAFQFRLTTDDPLSIGTTSVEARLFGSVFIPGSGLFPFSQFETFTDAVVVPEPLHGVVIASAIAFMVSLFRRRISYTHSK